MLQKLAWSSLLKLSIWIHFVLERAITAWHELNLGCISLRVALHASIDESGSLPSASHCSFPSTFDTDPIRTMVYVAEKVQDCFEDVYRVFLQYSFSTAPRWKMSGCAIEGQVTEFAAWEWEVVLDDYHMYALNISDHLFEISSDLNTSVSEVLGQQSNFSFLDSRWRGTKVFTFANKLFVWALVAIPLLPGSTTPIENQLQFHLLVPSPIQVQSI